MTKYYVDAAIWRDYYENRSDRFRPLGIWALDFFKKALEEEWVIICSDIVENELAIKYDKEHIKDILSVISKTNLLKRVEATPRQHKEARSLSKKRNVPKGDAFHAIIARDEGAILVTRDHHFDELQDVVRSIKPEGLI
jgi:predicted nucleic acid-binding protein